MDKLLAPCDHTQRVDSLQHLFRCNGIADLLTCHRLTWSCATSQAISRARWPQTIFDRHASNRDWPGQGGPGVTNQREAFRVREIDPKSVLAYWKKWEYITGADVTATPAVSNGVVYFPSYNGNLHAVSAKTGKQVWEKNLTQLTAGIPEVEGKDFVASLFNLTLYSRSTSVVVGRLLLIGLSSPAVVIAVRISWSSLLDAHPYAVVTMSGTAFEGHYYVGTSSLEETRQVGCRSFQGAFFKLELATGKILWRVAMAPDNGGKAGLYAGNAVWASNLPIDATRKLVYNRSSGEQVCLGLQMALQN